MDKINLKLEIDPLINQSVYLGGPVQNERGFVLHSNNVLGFVRWSAGQLEDKIARNGWLNTSTFLENIAEIIFDTPHAQRY